MNESGVGFRFRNGVPKLRNVTVRLIMPIPLSVCPSTMNNYFGTFVDFSKTSLEY